MEWIRIDKGLEYREHPTKKHGLRPDRYFRGRYKVDGKSKTIVFGWESDGRKNGRESFRDACMKELLDLKSNARGGVGPVTLKEKRGLAEKKREEKKRAADQEAMGNISFGDFFQDTYWPVTSTSKKEASYRKEMEHFRKWINPAVGALPFKNISQIQVEKIKRNMLRAKRSPRTIQYVFSTFRQVWNLAKATGLTVVDSPSKKVKIDMPDNERKRYLTDDEANSLLSALREKSEQVYQLSLVSLDSGARFSEIARLKWSHLDIDGGMITFVDTKKAGGTKSRVVPMTSRLKDLFNSMPMGGKNDLVFPSPDGKRFVKISNTFSRVVESIGLNAGISDPRMKVCFHSWRHTQASRLLQAGVGLYTVQKLLGHSLSKTTERYSHLSNETLVAAVKKMEQATKKKSEKADVIPLKVDGKK
jgi:integrase